jgi:N-acylneuraminate cytidylyltransferase
MIHEKSILAVIPARGGSKGLPRKNIRILAGKPLIAWTIEEAKKSKYIDRLILSSEDTEIISVAQQWGCDAPFVRPQELATDETPGVEPILHAIDALSEKYDYVVMLQPTSPLRIAEDIDGCIEMCVNSTAPVCVSMTKPEKSPEWMYRVADTGSTVPVTNLGYTSSRRQELQSSFVLSGAVYVAETAWLKQHRTFISEEMIAFRMPPDRSKDVDTDLDLEFCEFLLRKRG